MIEFKTLPPQKKDCGFLRVLKKLSDYEFGVEIWILRNGLNRNKWDYQNIQQNYMTFLGVPILCAYVGGKIGDGHNMRKKKDPKTGRTYYTFTDGTAERIVGTISDDPKDLSLKEKDGYTWIVAKGRLFAFYAPELVEKIVQTGSMEVSAETEVHKGDQDGDKEIYTEWAGLGVTILGDGVAPAVPGARISALAALQDEFNTLKLRAASLNENKPQNTKKKLKKGVTKRMNKQAIVRLQSKFDGYKIVGLSEDGLNVALIDSAGLAYMYTFNSADAEEAVDAAKIVPANVSVCFARDGAEDGIQADLADIADHVKENAAANDAEMQVMRNQLSEAQQEIAKLKTAEHDRRVQAVRDMLHATLAEIRETAEEDDDDMEDEEKEIEENAEAYSKMEKDGKFCGDSEARACLLSKAAEKRISKIKKQAAASKAHYAWDFSKKDNAEADGIDGMLSYINS